MGLHHALHTRSGPGAGALPAVYSAALEPRVRGVAAIGCLLSYRPVIDHPLYRQPLSSLPPGASPPAEAGALRELDWTRQIYRIAGAPAAFRLRCGVAPPRLAAALLDWLPAA